MKELLLAVVARGLAHPKVSSWLINRAMKTPYFHLASKDGSELYMARWWLLNPYDRKTNTPKWAPWFPWSIRIHHIVREDRDCDPHDHPWNARTFILAGWYDEVRIEGNLEVHRRRVAGHTAGLRFGEFHRITKVSSGGAITLFISGPYQGTWGFLVDGVKVQWKKYLGIAEDADLKPADAKAPESAQ